MAATLVACGAPDTGTEPAETATDLTRYVDPFIGTAGDHGQLHPAASVPFGMIQLGPETPGRSHSGYDYHQNTLLGFSHNRSSGVGCRGAGGNVLVRADYDGPAVEETVLHKDSEAAAPGFYRAEYGPDRILAEMTASRATGWQRYRFPRRGEVYLTINASHAHHEFYAADYTVSADGSIDGSVTGATVCAEGRYTVYFSLHGDREAEDIIELDEHRVALRYTVEADDEIVVTTAFSSLDPDAASRRRIEDTAQQTFEQVRGRAAELWRDKLSTVRIHGDEEELNLFYTSLYRVYLSPQRLADIGESYRESDGSVQTAGTSDHYFGWSLWDTFRTKYPLLTITEPAVAKDIGSSLAAMYRHSKPLWATDSEPWPTVRTEHSGIVLLDLWRKGLGNFDARALLPLLAAEADRMPRESPDQVLEAAYDDWAVGTFAGLLGEEAVATRYLARAAEYRPVWIDKFRDMGEGADIMHGDGLYEGTLWQYRWFVPFDIDWVIRQTGGPEGFTGQLSQFFEQRLFNMGNQPDIQAPFMFNFSGAPWRTQAVVRELLKEEGEHWYGTHEKHPEPYVGRVFRAQPEGFIPEMDDDAGTMSAWYVLASMGLYPVAPGVPAYSLHTPLYETATLMLQDGRTFEIRTDNPALPYIQSAALNGRPLDRAWLAHDEIVRGGTLEFVTGPEPSVTWGVADPCVTSLNEPAVPRCASGGE